jgi:hypothetical protein
MPIAIKQITITPDVTTFFDVLNQFPNGLSSGYNQYVDKSRPTYDVQYLPFNLQDILPPSSYSTPPYYMKRFDMYIRKA